MNTALKKKTLDNITVIMIAFNPMKKMLVQKGNNEVY